MNRLLENFKPTNRAKTTANGFNAQKAREFKTFQLASRVAQ